MPQRKASRPHRRPWSSAERTQLRREVRLVRRQLRHRQRPDGGTDGARLPERCSQRQQRASAMAREADAPHLLIRTSERGQTPLVAGGHRGQCGSLPVQLTASRHCCRRGWCPRRESREEDICGAAQILRHAAKLRQTPPASRDAPGHKPSTRNGQNNSPKAGRRCDTHVFHHTATAVPLAAPREAERIRPRGRKNVERRQRSVLGGILKSMWRQHVSPVAEDDAPPDHRVVGVWGSHGLRALLEMLESHMNHCACKAAMMPRGCRHRWSTQSDARAN